jgi:hypothetical protein
LLVFEIAHFSNSAGSPIVSSEQRKNDLIEVVSDTGSPNVAVTINRAIFVLNINMLIACKKACSLA